jgi:hypothetical protein
MVTVPALLAIAAGRVNTIIDVAPVVITREGLAIPAA